MGGKGIYSNTCIFIRRFLQIGNPQGTMVFNRVSRLQWSNDLDDFGLLGGTCVYIYICIYVYTCVYIYVYIYTYIIYIIYTIYIHYITLPPWLRKPPSSITCHGDPRWPTCGGTSKASSVGVAVPLSVGVAGTLRASMVVGLNPTRWCVYIWLFYMLIHIILYVNVMMLIHVILSLIVFCLASSIC